LRFVVLDEADEMLQMGFVDAIDSILGQVPAERQVALFSATLPPPIRRIAQKHLREPREVTIRSKTSTATNIRQRYWVVSGMHKLDALTRILEVEPFDAMLVFARTKQATVELAEKLEARGFAAAPLNGESCRRSASAPSPRSSPARSTSSLQPTSRRAASTSIGSATSLISTCRTTASRMCTGSAARARGPQRRGDPVHRAARAQHAAHHRARHPATDRAMSLPTVHDVNQRRSRSSRSAWSRRSRRRRTRPSGP